jgi:hypothetical protein
MKGSQHFFSFLKILNLVDVNIRTTWASRHGMNLRHVSQNSPGDNLQLHKKSMRERFQLRLYSSSLRNG